MAKFQVMNSTIGLSPANAAPTPRPAKPCSVIGVSMTRLAPNSSEQPLRDLVGALILGDLLAHHEDIAVAAHLFGHGVAKRLAHRLLHHLGAFRHFRRVERRRGLWKRRNGGNRLASGLRFLRTFVVTMLSLRRLRLSRRLSPQASPRRPSSLPAAQVRPVALRQPRRPRLRPGSPRSAC